MIPKAPLAGLILAPILFTLACQTSGASQVQVLTGKSGNAVTAAPQGQTLLDVPGTDENNAAVIFSNLGFKNPKAYYFCCAGDTISGPNSQLHAQQWIAIAFTPNSTATVRKIVLGLGIISGTNRMNIGLYSDAGGVPGEAIVSTVVTGLPSFGTCCAVARMKGAGAVVNAGTQYWVVVSTDGKSADTYGAWNFNSTDYLDPFTYAINQGSGWQVATGNPPVNVAVLAAN